MRSLSGAISLLAAGVQTAGVAVGDAIEAAQHGNNHPWSMGLSVAMFGAVVCGLIGVSLLFTGNPSPPAPEDR